MRPTIDSRTSRPKTRSQLTLRRRRFRKYLLATASAAGYLLPLIVEVVKSIRKPG